MTICFLDKSKVKQITALYRDNFSDGWSEDMLISGFESGRFYAIGAFEGQTLIGVITFSTACDEADIEGVTVDNAFRKRGIGYALYECAQKFLIEKGIKSIFLEVRATNFSAQNLYIKAGFNKISVRKNYYADGEDALVMKKEL